MIILVLIAMVFVIIMRDVPWEDTLKLGPSAAASEFCEWGQVGFDVYLSL